MNYCLSKIDTANIDICLLMMPQKLRLRVGNHSVMDRVFLFVWLLSPTVSALIFRWAPRFPSFAFAWAAWPICNTIGGSETVLLLVAIHTLVGTNEFMAGCSLGRDGVTRLLELRIWIHPIHRQTFRLTDHQWSDPDVRSCSYHRARLAMTVLKDAAASVLTHSRQCSAFMQDIWFPGLVRRHLCLL